MGYEVMVIVVKARRATGVLFQRAVGRRSHVRSEGQCSRPRAKVTMALQQDYVRNPDRNSKKSV